MQVLVRSTYVNGDRLVQPEWTPAQLAAKLESVTGIPPAHQRLFVEAGGARAPFTRGTLAELGLAPDSAIWVDDARPEGERLVLEGEGAKYDMPDAEYERRENTLLQWKKRNMLGRFAGDASHVVPASVRDDAPPAVAVGDPCVVTTSAREQLRGTVAFVGEVPTVEGGVWVGVRLATPRGKNDGSVRGMRLFDAAPNHGILVRAGAVRPLAEDEQEL